MKNDYQLYNNKDRKCFEFHIDEYVPKIDYLKRGAENVIYLTHTEVPMALEGQGIGSQLVEKSLQECENDGFKVIPSCPFVAAYIKRHPDWERVLAEGVYIR